MGGIEAPRQARPFSRTGGLASGAVGSRLGSGRTVTRDWGKVLVGLPTRATAWSVPHKAWHFDHPNTSPGVVNSINVFLLIDDVEPGGAGPAVVRNSPQLLDQLLEAGACSSSVGDQNRQFVAATEWTRRLVAGASVHPLDRTPCYLQDTLANGVPVRVEELSGQAGDVSV